MPVVPRPSFPWAAPTWPDGVELAPLDRTVGVDYDTAWSRRYGVRVARAALLDWLARPLVTALASPRVDGLDRIEHLDGPAIFAANHASHVDLPLVLSILPSRFRHRTLVGAGADYFFDTRWKAALWSFTIAAIPIERQRVNRRSAEEAGQLLGRGWSMVIFPEGGRTPDGWARPFRPASAGYLATRSGLPVVPIYLGGTRRILARGSGTLRPGSTRVCIGHPLRPQPDEDARRFSGRIEAAVAALADETTTDWWSARRRAAAGRTPSLGGPAVGTWRRVWALDSDRPVPIDRTRRNWPLRSRH
ncbi:MAG TPA: lysophospholipid acyltransferase family protein [Acidimicrobiales bacterium]